MKSEQSNLWLNALKLRNNTDFYSTQTQPNPSARLVQTLTNSVSIFSRLPDIKCTHPKVSGPCSSGEAFVLNRSFTVPAMKLDDARGPRVHSWRPRSERPVNSHATFLP